MFSSSCSVLSHLITFISLVPLTSSLYLLSAADWRQIQHHSKKGACNCLCQQGYDTIKTVVPEIASTRTLRIHQFEHSANKHCTNVSLNKSTELALKLDISKRKISKVNPMNKFHIADSEIGCVESQTTRSRTTEATPPPHTLDK